MSSQAAAALVLGFLVIVGIPILWWIFNSGPSPEKNLRAAERFRERQRHADFGAYKRRYGCEAPAALRQLFEDASVFSDDRDSFTVRLPSPAGERGYYVAQFEPIDDEHLNGMVWPGTENFYAFAGTGTGDRYLIEPCLPDPEVIYYEHETRKAIPLGVTLSRFLSLERTQVEE